jgi:drug/metabolite transporter, DME family
LTSSCQVKRHPVRGYLYIAAATLCWGISATLGRAGFTGRLFGGASLPPIDPLILAQTRTTISLLVLAPVLLFKRGRADLAMPRGDLLRALVLAVLGVAASNYFYYVGIQRTNVATAIIIQYTAPVWVLLYMVARGLQRPTASRVMAVALAVLGSALAIGLVGSGRFRIDRLGLLASLLAAFSFAFYNVYAHTLLVRHDRWRVLIHVLLGAAVFWMVINPPERILAQHYAPPQWAYLCLFAVSSVLIPFSFYFAGLQHLDATRAIVTSCLEPVFSILIAALVLSELLRPLQAVGITIVLVATILVQLPGSKPDQAAPLLEPVD